MYIGQITQCNLTIYSSISNNFIQKLIYGQVSLQMNHIGAHNSLLQMTTKLIYSVHFRIDHKTIYITSNNH